MLDGYDQLFLLASTLVCSITAWRLFRIKALAGGDRVTTLFAATVLALFALGTVATLITVNT
jgi:hypothetical protein